MSDKKARTKKSTKWRPRRRRTFSETFKREKVAEITSGQISIARLSRLWDVSTKSIYRWIYQYSNEHQKGTVMVVQKESEASKLQALQQQVAALEQALGQKQMVIDYQNQLLKEASQDLGFDVKKNTKSKC